MTTKKIFAILMMALLMFSMVPLAIADEDTSDENVDDVSDDENEEDVADVEDNVDDDESDTTDETNDEEVEEIDNEEVEDADTAETADFDNTAGVELRLLQLEKALTGALLSGSSVAERIEAADAEADVSELQGILDELEALIAEVQEQDPAEDQEVLAEWYVDVKQEARDIIKSFREEARELTTPEERQEMRDEVKGEVREGLEGLNDEVKERRRLLNAERVSRVLERAGIDADDIRERVESGDLSPKEAKMEIRDRFKELSPEERKEVGQKTRENMAKRKVFKQAAHDKRQENRDGRMQERKQKRMDKVDEIRADPNRAEKVRDRVAHVKERVGERNDKVREKTREVRDKVRERAGEARERIKAKVSERRDQIKDRASDARDEIKSRAGEARDQIKDRATDARANIKDRAQSAIDSGADPAAVKDRAQDARANVKDKAQDARANVKDKAQDARANVKDRAQNAKANVKDRAQDARASAKDKARDARPKIQQTSSRARGALQEKGVNARKSGTDRRSELIERHESKAQNRDRLRGSATRPAGADAAGGARG